VFGLYGKPNEHYVYGPGYWDFDISLLSVRISDQFRLQFRAEAFNHAYFLVGDNNSLQDRSSESRPAPIDAVSTPRTQPSPVNCRGRAEMSSELAICGGSVNRNSEDANASEAHDPEDDYVNLLGGPRGCGCANDDHHARAYGSVLTVHGLLVPF